jgi:hypothetical protein
MLSSHLIPARLVSQSVDAEAAAAVAEQSRPGINDLNAAIGEIAIASCELGVVRNRYRRDLAVNFAHLSTGTVALCHQRSIGARRFFIERNDGTAANLKGQPIETGAQILVRRPSGMASRP